MADEIIIRECCEDEGQVVLSGWPRKAATESPPW